MVIPDRCTKLVYVSHAVRAWMSHTTSESRRSSGERDQDLGPCGTVQYVCGSRKGRRSRHEAQWLAGPYPEYPCQSRRCSLQGEPIAVSSITQSKKSTYKEIDVVLACSIAVSVEVPAGVVAAREYSKSNLGDSVVLAGAGLGSTKRAPLGATADIELVVVCLEW
jgi:hypothetical protein